MQALDVPLYLHPDDSFVKPYVLEGCDELLKPTWEWTTETSSHFLRLVFAGVFDGFHASRSSSATWGRRCPTCFGVWTAAPR
jgi:hypothetical protein